MNNHNYSREFIGMQEAADLLGIRYWQLDWLCRKPGIPVVRCGRIKRFNRKRLLDWWAEHGDEVRK